MYRCCQLYILFVREMLNNQVMSMVSGENVLGQNVTQVVSQTKCHLLQEFT